MSSKDDFKSKPCWVYIDGEPATSYQELIKGISSQNMEEKEQSLMKLIKSIINDENYPTNVMIKVINSLLIVEDQRIKKLLLLFWEILEKRNQDGGIKEEFYLVCNNLRKDLNHPNEFLRGRTLRLLSKLPYKEILESLTPVLIENLNHKHPYVRRNALMCIVSIVKSVGSDFFSNKLNTKLIELIDKDSDLSTKRNAYLALAALDIEASIKVTIEIVNNPELNELGDIFILAIIQNIKKLCDMKPRDKSKYLKLLVALSNHKSHSVSFEIANSLIQLSSHPNIIKTAINLFTNLLVEQSENNIRVIILKKLMELKHKYKEILEEQVLYYTRIINSSCTNELRKLIFEMIGELITESNINSVIEILISDFNKLKHLQENEQLTEYKNLVLNSIFNYIMKFPNIKQEFPLFLIEKCLLYDSKNTFIDEQLAIIKETVFLYSSKLHKEMLEKILLNFEDITIPEILQGSIWILAEYTNDMNVLKRVFDVIMKNIGDLNLELAAEKDTNEKSKSTTSEKKVITKTVVLSDGTYGTQTIILDSEEALKQKETKFLRKFILEKNFFFSTCLVVSISKIIFKLKLLDTNKEFFNTYFFNAINILCAILKINSHKVFKDPDNVSRIHLCLEFLMNNDYEKFLSWLQESRDIFSSFHNKQRLKEKDKHPKVDKKVLKSPDEFISFRHVKPFDSENLDLLEEDTDDSIVRIKTKPSSDGPQFKFNEILTGTEDPIHLEATIEIFSYDIVIEFLIVNKTKNILQNITIEQFVPSNLEIIERPQQISLNGEQSRTLRSCIKFTSTSNSFIFGQISYSNHKGVAHTLNINGIFIDLINTFAAECTESHFRKCWVEYNWEHKVILISKLQSFKEVIDLITQNLNLRYIGDYELIDEDSGFLVANLYTKSKLGEDALINLSIEKANDKRIVGNAIIRSKVKDFTQFIGDKIKLIVK